jgi:dTDP-4-amino-4,6-dideoxygalactose transaminase
LPNAELISEEAINIPLHQNLTEGDISKIVEVVKKFY